MSVVLPRRSNPRPVVRLKGGIWWCSRDWRGIPCSAMIITMLYSAILCYCPDNWYLLPVCSAPAWPDLLLSFSTSHTLLLSLTPIQTLFYITMFIVRLHQVLDTSCTRPEARGIPPPAPRPTAAPRPCTGTQCWSGVARSAGQ